MLVAAAHLGDQIKPELHRSVVEVGTPGLRATSARRGRRCSQPRALCVEHGRDERRAHRGRGHPSLQPLEGPGDHRTASRYKEIVNEMEDLARANLIFGLHVHVGDRGPGDADPDHERACVLFLPHLLALSGELALLVRPQDGREVRCARRSSSASRARRSRTSTAPGTTTRSYVDLLVRTNCIDDGKKIWWDVRPHAYFKTLEFRICDIPRRDGGDDHDRRPHARPWWPSCWRLIESQPRYPRTTRAR